MEQGTAIVALGSNIGESTKILRNALEALQNLSRKPVRASSFYRSSPVDCSAGSPDFINGVVILFPLEHETPISFLRKLQELEIEFGRRPKTIMNEPRPLDLDLIAFGEEIVNEAGLILPHPRADVRRFVLEPLNELEPGLILPGWKKTVAQLLKQVPDDQILEKIST